MNFLSKSQEDSVVDIGKIILKVYGKAQELVKKMLKRIKLKDSYFYTLRQYKGTIMKTVILKKR